MSIPLAQEKVLRGTLQALQRGGLISSGADVAKLENIPNNASDADISAILDTIVFGGVASATDTVRGDEDVNIFVDADNNDGPITPRYFRVAQDQSDPPVTNYNNELLTVTKLLWDAATHVTDLVVGPRTSITASDTRARIRVGSNATEHYGNVIGGADAVNSSAGLLVASRLGLGLGSDTHIIASDEDSSFVRGGWNSPKTVTEFHVGDFKAATPESLVIEQETISGNPVYTVRPTFDGAQVRAVYFRGSNPASGYRSTYCFGGKAGEAWSNLGNFANPTLSVIGDSNSSSSNSMYVYDYKTTRDSSSEVFTIESTATTGGVFFYFRIIDNAGAGVFNIDSNGNANLGVGGVYQSTGADVAERVRTDVKYDPGTVLAIENGMFVKTSSIGQANVAGVVATAPGVLLGSTKYPGKTSNRMAIAGIVPVLCSTTQGDILGNGEFLVSGPDGHAVVSKNPAPGTIIGKAKGKLLSSGSTPVKGSVEALVNLQ